MGPGDPADPKGGTNRQGTRCRPDTYHLTKQLPQATAMVVSGIDRKGTENHGKGNGNKHHYRHQ